MACELSFFLNDYGTNGGETTNKQGKLIAVFNGLKSRVLKLFLTDKESIEQ